MSLSKLIKRRLRHSLSLINRDRPALLTFLFHSLFRDQREIDLNHVDPQQCVTGDHMVQFIRYFQSAGYRFIAPGQLNEDLDPAGNYLLITFDDGYYNNTRMLDIMEQHEVPATFFVTTGNLLRNECFWWDVVYRERRRQGKIRAEISAEQKSLKKFQHVEICDRLRRQFGENCFAPWSDTDRVMTVGELQEFAGHPLVSIGNHTTDHFLLDNYPESQVLEQIANAQVELQQMLGSKPDIIAYPNGNYSAAAIRAARRAGLKTGITVDKRKNYLPIDWHSDEALQLGRFVLWGTEDIATQCDIFRSDFRI